MYVYIEMTPKSHYCVKWQKHQVLQNITKSSFRKKYLIWFNIEFIRHKLLGYKDSFFLPVVKQYHICTCALRNKNSTCVTLFNIKMRRELRHIHTARIYASTHVQYSKKHPTLVKYSTLRLTNHNKGHLHLEVSKV